MKTCRRAEGEEMEATAPAESSLAEVSYEIYHPKPVIAHRFFSDFTHIEKYQWNYSKSTLK